MMKCIKKKQSLDQSIIESIEWEGIEGMMKQSNPINRIQLLKMLHGWQNLVLISQWLSQSSWDMTHDGLIFAKSPMSTNVE